MVNKEILGGIRTAMDKGESLKSAMFSFYNAGYKKEEIEEAARYVMANKQNPQPEKPQDENKKKYLPSKSTKPIPPKVSSYGKPSEPPKMVPQKPIENNQIKQNKKEVSPEKKSVSKYGSPVRKPKFLIYLVLFVILFAVAGLIGAIFFKDQFVEILESILG
jgi:hypothetical protein